MTKNEYIEFINLQEHYEWLHAAEDRAKTKLETFTIDDSEFDELVREAVKVYFETEIDKTWKQIEEFKTSTAKTANERSTGKTKKMDVLIFKLPDGKDVSIMRDILEKSNCCCNQFECDDPRNPCPFKEGGSHSWFRDCFDRGCSDIFAMFCSGKYRILEV